MTYLSIFVCVVVNAGLNQFYLEMNASNNLRDFIHVLLHKYYRFY